MVLASMTNDLPNHPVQVAAYSTANGSLLWGPFTASQSSVAAISVSDDAFFFVGQPLSGQLYQPFAVNSDFGDQRFPPPPANTPPLSWNLDPQQAPLVGESVIVCSGDFV